MRRGGTTQGIVPFYVLAVAITTACSFACWVAIPYVALNVVAAQSGPWLRTAQEALLVMAACGPGSAALIVTGLRSGRAGVRSLLHSPVRRAGSWAVLGIVLAAMAVCYLGPSWLGIAYGQAVPGRGGFSVSSTSATMWVGLIVGALGEEIGWRGFLQPRLRTRFGDLLSCVLVAGLWWLWHYFCRLPFAMGSGGWFLLSVSGSQLSLGMTILPLSMILFRVYQWTGQSVIAVSVAHLVVNLLAVAQLSLFDPERPVSWYWCVALLWVAGAIACVVRFVPGPE